MYDCCTCFLNLLITFFSEENCWYMINNYNEGNNLMTGREIWLTSVTSSDNTLQILLTLHLNSSCKVLLVMTQCILTSGYQIFWDNCYVHLISNLKKAAAIPSETSVSIIQAGRYHDLKNRSTNFHCPGYLKCQISHYECPTFPALFFVWVYKTFRQLHTQLFRILTTDIKIRNRK